VSLTIDTWTNKNGDNFLSVTGHWISDSRLRSAQLALTRVDGRHTGKNLARLLVQVIDCYGLQKKVLVQSKCIVTRLLMTITDRMDYC
jgi:hypothetical protein